MGSLSIVDIVSHPSLVWRYEKPVAEVSYDFTLKCLNCNLTLSKDRVLNLENAVKAERAGRFEDSARIYENLNFLDKARSARLERIELMRPKSSPRQSRSIPGDSYEKGDEFEAYALKLFRENEFDCLQATPRRDDLEGRRIESKLDPDFKFRHKLSNHEFWVECKYRANSYGGKLVWCKEYQLKRYRDIQERERPRKVYVVIGLGGKPSAPEMMFNIPLDEIGYCGIFPSRLRDFKRNPTAPFDYQHGRLA